ncbi:MAG: tRNA (adenosine(37)-N6)-dimethylallyltransferase MiaA [Hungatella sp.]|jgi:tRNA dimethylallyltransferase|nr:tRNA (adenosine(37)-N6)-dimethylallyltransferase MiaA [Hungatella sp.]MCI9636074.1 tRNA (adenosine(37)-N6)-dimethylallyltransferase MiaA [Hungatella sp.]
MDRPLIILTGPTAVGKTKLSIDLAKAMGGEIVSADSIQVYRHMDIGSAKVTKSEMGGVPHHLIDVLDPTEEFNVVIFQKMAKEAVEGILNRGHIPVVVGGTGFYIQALAYDIDFTENDQDRTLRLELERIAGEKGGEYLHKMLEEVDPAAADQIHANNIKRVIRAIEFYRQTGTRISEHNEAERKKSSPYQLFYYVLNTRRSILYDRVERRVEQMMEQGLLEEVKKLAAMGCARDMVSMQGLGYKELLDHLEGRCTLEEAVYTIKRDTRHFAKRQLTWFKREKDVRWLNLPDFHDNLTEVLDHILQETRELWN